MNVSGAPVKQTGRATVTLSDGAADLDGILALQRENLLATVGAEEAQRSGFVTVVHTRSILEAMHALAPSVIARADDVVVGYALTMPVAGRSLLPILEPLFALLDDLTYRAVPLNQTRYYVMGQICIARSFRGNGLFEAMYALHAATFADRFDLIVTEVARRNSRSLKAHARVGFEILTEYRDATDDWVVLGMQLAPSQANVRVQIASWSEHASALTAVRARVFVQEQGVPESLESDGLDASCAHVLAVDVTGDPIGAARMTPDGRIGRMAVLPKFRSQGIGARLLQALIELARARGLTEVHLHAQLRARAFYERHGFRMEGAPFMEAGIPHVHMRASVVASRC